MGLTQQQVGVRLIHQLDPTLFPLRLETYPLDFAFQTATEWAKEHPEVGVDITKVGYGVHLTSPMTKGGEVTTIKYPTLYPDDLRWYLETTKVPKAKQEAVLNLIDSNLDLIPTALTALPHMDYFLKTLESGERMKRYPAIVQACIQLVVYHQGVILPTEVSDYVLHECPEFGAWLESHIDRFYELLRGE